MVDVWVEMWVWEVERLFFGGFGAMCEAEGLSLCRRLLVMQGRVELELWLVPPACCGHVRSVAVAVHLHTCGSVLSVGHH